MKENNELLEKLQELIRWNRINAIPRLKKILEDNFKADSLGKEESEARKLLYHFSGIKTSSELSKITGISTGKISKLWNKWFRQGLVKKKGRQYQKLFSLEDWGYSIPNVKENPKEG